MKAPPIIRTIILLLVEIHDFDPEWIESQLEPRGYAVVLRHAMNQAALEEALAMKPDLILTGANRNGLNAIRVLETLQEHNLDIPVVVIAKEGEEDLALDCQAHGAADYLLEGHLLRLGYLAVRLVEHRQIKQVPQGNQESQLRVYYNVLFENAREIILLVNPDDERILDANLYAEEVYGYSREELMLMTISNLRSVDISPEIVAQLNTYDPGGLLFETVHRRKDGTLFPVEVSATSVIIGKKHAKLSIVRDISVQKRAEVNLRETNQRLSAMIHASPLAVLTLDKIGLVQLWSPAAERLFGWQAAEIIGKPLPIIPQDQLDEVNQQIQEELQGVVRMGLEGKRCRKDGSLVDVRISTSPIHNDHGDITGSIALIEDITPRKRAEAALRESEERFRALIEKAPVAIAIARGGVTIYNNPPFLSMFGYASPQETEGRALVEQIAPHSREEIAARNLRRETGQSVEADYESIGLRKDGSQFPLHVAVTRVDLKDGPATFAFFRDITRQKRAEAELLIQADHARALADLSSRLNAQPDLIRILIELSHEVVFSLNAPFCAIYLLDEEKGTLVPTCNFGYPPDDWSKLQAIPVHPSQGNLNDPSEKGEHAKEEGFRLWNILVDGKSEPNPLYFVSIRYQDKLIGQAGIPPRPEGDYTAEEKSLFQAFANQSATAIVNMELYEQTRDRVQELQVLANVSSSLRRARDLKEIVPLLVAQTVQVMQADNGDLVLFPGDEFMQASIMNLPSPDPIWMTLTATRTVQQAFTHSQVFYCEDLTLEPEIRARFQGKDLGGIRSFAIVQLKTLDHAIGALCVAFNQPRHLAEDDQRLLTAIGDIAANALHRTSLMGTLEQRVQVRTRDLEALYDIAALTSAPIDLDDALGQCLDKVLDIFHIQSGLIQLLSEDGQTLVLSAKRGIPDDLDHLVHHVGVAGSIWARAISQKSPYISSDFGSLFQDPGDSRQTVPDVFLATPLRVKGEILGVISIFRPSLQEFSVEEIALLSTIANQIGVAVDSARLRKRSEEAAILEDRQRFARDLHDSVTQSLYSLNLMAEGYRKRIPNASPVQIDAWLSELGGLAHQALKDIRLLLYELRPSSIQYDGIAVAINRRLEAVEARSGVKFKYSMDGDLRLLSIMEEEELYHIVQEALNNSLKHAQATRVAISLSVEENHLTMEVLDNGIGFDLKAAYNGGLGIMNMDQRAKRIGADFEISSEPGSGTCVRVEKSKG